MSSARVRLQYDSYDSFEGGPSPQYHEGQQQQQQQQQQQEVPHQHATVGTNANNESTKVTNDVGWLDNMDEGIRLRREELARLREDSKASVHLLESKARSGLSPAFSPSVQQFVSNVMAGGLTTSSFSGGPLSGRTPLGPGNERTPTLPGGGDFLRTPRTAGGGAANPSSSLRTKGALGFIKDEAVRLRGKRMLRRGVGGDHRWKRGWEWYKTMACGLYCACFSARSRGLGLVGLCIYLPLSIFSPCLFLPTYNYFHHASPTHAVDLEQQAGLLASEKQHNDQLQDELRVLAGERERLREEVEARERQMREYERALAEAQAAEEERRNEDRQRQESFQVR